MVDKSWPKWWAVPAVVSLDPGTQHTYEGLRRLGHSHDAAERIIGLHLARAFPTVPDQGANAMAKKWEEMNKDERLREIKRFKPLAALGYEVPSCAVYNQHVSFLLEEYVLPGEYNKELPK